MSASHSVAHYRITAKLGEGGMGEVWRALDTKLGRDVALKILPDSLAADGERLARFSREAHVLASLNHPNIAAIYGVEDRALVLELVEGPTLAERIAQGPIPPDEALPIVEQLIDGLEYAHERGIVHRDLKPANIKLTSDGRVKILDFGLARAFTSDGASGNPETSPTLTFSETTPGRILGTARYMSPEQARGRSVDVRADIWAFGVILYEMLTGTALFAGDTVGDTLAAVLRQEVDLGSVPSRFSRLLGVCLERDVRQRLRHIGDARFLMSDTPVAALAGAHAPRGRLLWGTVLVSAFAAIAAAMLVLRLTRPGPRQPIELSVDLGEHATLDSLNSVAMSRDGSHLAFLARLPAGGQRLAVRSLGESQPTLLAGTEQASMPVFSPDGRWLCFFADGKVKKVAVQGGSPAVLCDAPSSRGLSWGDDGYIYAALNTSAGIARVPEGGGTPIAVTALAGDERSHRWPQAVPGSRILLFSSSRILTDWDQANVEAISLSSRERTVLVRGGYYGRYLPTGHLVYVRDGSLRAARLDLNNPRLAGEGTPIIPSLAVVPTTGGAQFAFSDAGLMVYAAAAKGNPAYPLGWMRRDGKVEPLPVPEAPYSIPRLSPDGNRLAFVNMETEDVWTFDFRRGSFVRITSSGDAHWYPVWAPDGEHLFFSSNVKEGHAILWARADGSGSPIKLLERTEWANPFSISPDGRTLAYTRGSGIELARLDLSDPVQPKVISADTWLPEGMAPMFSPDGRWIAYVSRESGRPDVYVRPAPGANVSSTAKWVVSTAGARVACWAPKGRRLFYSTLDNLIVTVDYTIDGNVFQPGAPRRWSDSPIRGTAAPNFDVAPDGLRILAFPPAESPDAHGNLHLTFVFNFFDELRRKLP